MTPEISIVLPCRNEAGNIPGLVERYRALTDRTALELIFVDNASTDGTGGAIDRELARPENGFARKVRVERNLGYGHGIKRGLEAARAPVVAFSHADLQCPPEDTVRALALYREIVEEGPCMIKGRRRGERAPADRIVTWFYNRLAYVALDFPSALDVNAEPKLFDRAFAAELERGPDDFTFDLYALYLARRKGRRIEEFEVDYEARTWGKSKLAADPRLRLKTSLNAFLMIWRLRLASYR